MLVVRIILLTTTTVVVSSDSLLLWCLKDRTGNSTKARETGGSSARGAVAQFGGDRLTWFTRWGDAHIFTTVANGEHWSWGVTSTLGWAIVPFWWDEIMEQQILDAQLFVDNWHWGGAVSDAGLAL